MRMLELNAAVDLLLGSDTPTVEIEYEPQRSDRRADHEGTIATRLASAMRCNICPMGIYVVGTRHSRRPAQRDGR